MRAPVAQSDRASGFEPLGRRFDPCQAHKDEKTPKRRIRLWRRTCRLGVRSSPPACRQAGARVVGRLKGEMKKALALGLILALLNSCAHGSRSITDSSQYSKVEMELGEAIHRQIVQSLPIYQDEDLNLYVQTIGERLARASERKNLPYRFVILEDDRIYSTHAPGGYVYLTTGFFRFLVSEIELAGILAQEVAMLQYKDPRLSKVKKALELLLQTGGQVAPAFGAIGALSVVGLALITYVTTTPKTIARRLRDADRRALRYLAESGFDPQGLIDPLRRMQDSSSPYRAYLYDYLQSHPITADRLERLDQAFSKLPLSNRQFDSGRSTYLALTESIRNTNVRK